MRRATAPADPASSTLTATVERGPGSGRQGLQAHLFVVLDRARPLAGGSRHSLANVEHVTLGRGETRCAARIVEGDRPTLRLRIADPRMSAAHARLEPDAGTWAVVDSRSTNGVVVNGRRVERATLNDGDVLELGDTFLRFRAATVTPFDATGDVDSTRLQGLPAALGTLGPLATRALEDLGRVARSDMAVLLEGETGTGKEVLARAIHEASGRPGPFVAVNCGALPEGIVESLLFGHKKGAFSGAVADAQGFVRAADGGTLFLDEIGDLPAASQAALLRVVQEREVVPLGASAPHAVDVRFVAATHHSLTALAAAAAFRKDLLARLSQFTHTLLPLRDRIEDLGVLIAAILPRVARQRAGSLSLGASSARAMLANGWPANVRELEHRLGVSVVLARQDRLDVALGPAAGPVRPAEIPAVPVDASGRRSPEDEALHAELVARLTEHRGNVTQVAQAMNKARRQVQRWIERLQIDAGRFRA